MLDPIADHRNLLLPRMGAKGLEVVEKEGWKNPVVLVPLIAPFAKFAAGPVPCFGVVIGQEGASKGGFDKTIEGLSCQSR